MNVRSSRTREAGAPGQTGRMSKRGAGQRQRRVGEELRHLLAGVLQKGECRDAVLREAAITVTEVRLSPDLRNATAYVIPLGGANGTEVVAAMQRNAGFFRGRMARGAALRHAPNLSFALDQTFDQADRIAALLARPDVERDLQTTSATGEAGDDAE
jgi:ribosome-binding factor A